MLRVGLTGGVASGKSTVADLFAQLGAVVLDTDQIAHEIVEPGQPALSQLIAALGNGILGPDGRLDRPRLRARMFADEELRRAVESVLHPLILAELGRRSEAAAGPYQILVIPLLVEGDYAGLVDRVLVVDCPPEMQIERLMLRDDETRVGAQAMLDAQAGRLERLKVADDLIVNNGAVTDLGKLVADLDRQYRRLASKQRVS
jgi:dephospho-CoA kinase